MFDKAHSLQKMSPCEQDTGVRAGRRHRRHEAKGRKESRDSRAVFVAHADLARPRS